MTSCNRFLSLALVAVSTVTLAAQAPPGAPESTDVSAGWSALAAGDAATAAAIADGAAGRFPGSLAVGALLVPAEIERAGATAGLAAYERWLGGRSLEEPSLVRLVASGLLRETLRSPGAPVGNDVRRIAYQALALDGDVASLPPLGDAARSGDIYALQELGVRGNEQAVRNLIAALQNAPGDRSRAIAALAATKSPLAIQPLIDELGGLVSTDRMAAATALGQLGAAQAANQLRAILLQNVPFGERFAAAGALFRLHDGAGIAFLGNLLNSDSSMIRVQVLEAEASDPNALWLDAVRRLLADPDPVVRLIAIRLMAPHDQAAANAAVQGLLTDANPANAEAASALYAQMIASDLPSLHRLLHSADALTRTSAAARVLDLTR